MKIQSLAIIFIIIIIPITIVLSEYVNNKIKTEVTELEYNTRLLNATYDSIKAYQINTVNNAFGDVTNSKITDIEAAVTTFYNSLANNFNFTGYKASVMKEYIPAVAFTLYDGYYIFSPFNNELTGVDVTEDDGDPVDYDETYSKPGEVINGLKPYVYYSARYIYDNHGTRSDFVINYTLDNYITIMGTINGSHVYDFGYLYPIAEISGNPGIYYNSANNSYTFDGITFQESDTEELKEFVGETLYSYAKINGKKYYLEENGNAPRDISYNGQTITINRNAKIFYIDNNGAKNYSQAKEWDKCENDTDRVRFIKYYRAIKENKSAYIYYKRAYEFSSMVLGHTLPDQDNYVDKSNNPQKQTYNLSELKTGDAYIYAYPEIDNTTGITLLNEYDDGNVKIFDGDIHLASSNFNKHRKAIIRYVIETNMSSAISGFSSSVMNPKGIQNLEGTDSGAYREFIMPKISETDWDIIQNDVCEISFLQGLNMGSKKYNGYAVVANMLTKEYIDEDDIYILKDDDTYCKVNDSTIDNSNIKPKKSYYSGIWKIDFERKRDLTTNREIFYYPVGYNILGSYTSIMGSFGINEIGTTECPDMYTYMDQLSGSSSDLKEIYYKALGRERWGSYNVNNVNYEIYHSNANEYFLRDY